MTAGAGYVPGVVQTTTRPIGRVQCMLGYPGLVGIAALGYYLNRPGTAARSLGRPRRRRWSVRRILRRRRAGGEQTEQPTWGTQAPAGWGDIADLRAPAPRPLRRDPRSPQERPRTATIDITGAAEPARTTAPAAQPTSPPIVGLLPQPPPFVDLPLQQRGRIDLLKMPDRDQWLSDRHR